MNGPDLINRAGMSMHLRPGRAVDREPDARSYTDGWRAAKADSRRLLDLADALLRDRVTPDGRALLDELLILHAENEQDPK